MRLLLTLICLVFFCVGHAQRTYVKVLGIKTYTGYPTAYVYKMNPGDPSISELTILKSTLDSLGIVYRIDSVTTAWRDPTIEKSINIYTYDKTHFDLLCQQAGLNAIQGNVKYIFDHDDFAYQDTLARAAYNDALRRAKVISELLGKEIIGVINIDDHVERYLFYQEYFSDIECYKQNFDEILEFLELLASIDTEPAQSERTGQYALWVTFELN